MQLNAAPILFAPARNLTKGFKNVKKKMFDYLFFVLLSFTTFSILKKQAKKFD
jgi:hypothetical protein